MKMPMTMSRTLFLPKMSLNFEKMIRTAIRHQLVVTFEYEV